MAWRGGHCACVVLGRFHSPVAAAGMKRATPLARRVAPPSAKPLVFVGFDASEVLVDAMRQGKIHGLVVQNPLRMGKLSVQTMVKHLEKQAIEKQISTGETLVTPQNMNDPDVAPLIHPPQVDNASDVEPFGNQVQEVQGDRDSQGDDA